MAPMSRAPGTGADRRMYLSPITIKLYAFLSRIYYCETLSTLTRITQTGTLSAAVWGSSLKMSPTCNYPQKTP
jgi:hypothetical protein